MVISSMLVLLAVPSVLRTSQRDVPEMLGVKVAVCKVVELVVTVEREQCDFVR